ncbi:thiamine pyrophosphate-requiring protein [Thalassoroseus pseudoceratinae]|uniref:thiamine pyrophosphate-requiring protein n=1 Tax=Thalassoroseus pseudoceratinae TaxID=2713176 RepID=UPI0014245506|nr:thiamine pyrophosphate-requiring protein [Thalassoroseus pseudoceratinae]
MADNVGDFLLERLRQWGVKRIYGFPGDGINGIMGALGRADNQPKFVQARHEEMSAFMACGHAKFTGEVGVCIATSGPGAIHTLNGLYDAKLDHQPVLAIVGQQPRTALGEHYQQEVDLQTLFKDVTAYVQTVMSPEQLPAVIDQAMRTAIAERSPVCLIFPADVQELDAVKETPHKFKMSPGSLGMVKPRVLPPDASIREAAQIINGGKKVGILVGQGARSAADEVIELAERTGGGVAKALLGKDVLPDDLPFVTGSIGLLGTYPSYELMMGCDTFLMIGSNFPYAQFLPKFGQARGIQIDIDGKLIGLRYPMELNLVGDAKSTLQALLPFIDRKEDRSWRETIEKNNQTWNEIIEKRAHQSADPVNPQRVFWELSPLLPDDCIVTADSGSGTNWFARDVKLRKGMQASLSGTLATMGCGVPYAIAAKFCHPNQPVVALVGDGAMQMNGMAELLTVRKYWEEWDNPQFIVLVVHNNDLNQVTWEMRVMEGDPKFEAAQVLPDMNYAAFADMIGLEGIRVERTEDIVPAWEHAFSASRPIVIDALCDPEVPPLPPHTTFDQAMGMLKSLIKGDPEAGDIIKHGFKGKIAEYVH